MPYGREGTGETVDVIEASLLVPVGDFVEDYRRVREETSEFAAGHGAEFDLTPEDHERIVGQYLRQDTVNVEFLILSEGHTMMVFPLNHVPYGAIAAWQETRGARLRFRDLDRG